MPLKVELNAIKKNFTKLMKLPVKDLLPAMKAADVVSDDQREQMNAMKLDKERAGYLLDNVIIPSLKVDVSEPFYNFLQVLEDDDNPVVLAIVKELRLSLGPPMPSQPSYPNPAQYPSQSYPGQYPPSAGQPYPGQYPSQAGQYSTQYTPQAGQPYPGQYPPSAGQPYPGQYPPSAGQPYPGQYPSQAGQYSTQYTPQAGQYPAQYNAQAGQPYFGQQPQQPYPEQPKQPNEGITSEKVLKEGKGGGYIDQASMYECMRAVCLIKDSRSLSNKGTGIIGRYKMKDSTIYVLLTCNHVIPTEEEAKRALLYFGYTDDTREPSPLQATSILDTTGRWFWSDPAYYDQDKKKMGYNYTMMKVKKTELDKIKFVEKDESMNIKGIQLLNNEVRLGKGDNYTLISQTPSMKSANGRCTEDISSAVVKYAISTSRGSAGGPVFKEDGNMPRLVAVHNGSSNRENYGVCLSEILKHWTTAHGLRPMPHDTANYKLE